MCKKILQLAFFSFICVAAFAQDYVTVYEDCNYSGKKYNLAAGSYLGYAMKIGNDKLSSIIIPRGMKITIYEHDKYEGRSKTFYENTPCLPDGWNEMASSIVVESEYGGQSNYGQNDYVTFFNDCYSKGYSQSLRPGSYTGSQLGPLKYNISSFSISGNLRIKIYLNSESLSGASSVYEVDQACLPGYQNDRIGSLVIEYKSSQPNYPGGGNHNNGGNYPGGGNHNNNNNYATVYTDCNYRGNSLRLAPGYYQGDKLGLLKYNISSIEIPSNLTAKVYINNEYLSGSYYTITTNNNCMSSTLDNRIGSLIIEDNYSNNNNNGNNYPPDGNDKVVIYVDEDYKGQSASLLPGTYATMVQAGFPDKAMSSLTVPPGYRVVIYDQENFRGKSYTITASKTKFYLSGWSDKTSSIAVYRN